MGTIYIIGLGPGSYRDLTVGALELLRSSLPIFFRTKIHPVVGELCSQGVVFQSFDDVYERAESFQQVYEEIAETVLLASREGDVVYAVPGHPLVAEQSVVNIIERAKQQGATAEIIPAMSFLDAIFSSVAVDPVQGMTLIDALQMDKQEFNPAMPVIITQVYSQMVASDVKLSLMEQYPDEHQIAVIRAAGIPKQEQMSWIPLFELDRIPWVDHLTSIYIPAYTGPLIGREYSLTPLVEIMETLRSPGGCPWDIEQSHPSLKRYIVEEVYEVLEAIDLNDMEKLCDELGDLLLQIVFHGRIAEENGDFSMQDIINGVTEKMLRRHPHVFGNVTADTPDDVMVNWEKIKQTEQAGVSRISYLDGVPIGLPALMRAFKLQGKAAKVGFDWKRIEDVWEKVSEEMGEFDTAFREQDKDAMEAEMGDVFFALVNVARFAGIEPETALHRTNLKFLARFKKMEELAKLRKKSIESLSLEVLNTLWNEVKALEAAKNL